MKHTKVAHSSLILTTWNLSHVHLIHTKSALLDAVPIRTLPLQPGSSHEIMHDLWHNVNNIANNKTPAFTVLPVLLQQH